MLSLKERVVVIAVVLAVVAGNARGAGEQPSVATVDGNLHLNVADGKNIVFTSGDDSVMLAAITGRLSDVEASAADTTYVDGELAKKVDQTDYDAAIALKAATTYVDGELAKKVDQTDYDAAIALKAATTYVDGELAKKVAQTDYDTAIALKAATTYVDGELAKKVDQAAYDTAIAAKADSSVLNNKASELQANIDLCATSVALEAGLGTKADAVATASDISELRNSKADLADMLDRLATKADDTATAGALELKADLVYTDSKLAEKADDASTNAALGLKADQTSLDSLDTFVRDLEASHADLSGAHDLTLEQANRIDTEVTELRSAHNGRITALEALPARVTSLEGARDALVAKDTSIDGVLASMQDLSHAAFNNALKTFISSEVNKLVSSASSGKYTTLAAALSAVANNEAAVADVPSTYLSQTAAQAYSLKSEVGDLAITAVDAAVAPTFGSLAALVAEASSTRADLDALDTLTPAEIDTKINNMAPGLATAAIDAAVKPTYTNLAALVSEASSTASGLSSTNSHLATLTSTVSNLPFLTAPQIDAKITAAKTAVTALIPTNDEIDERVYNGVNQQVSVASSNKFYTLTQFVAGVNANPPTGLKFYDENFYGQEGHGLGRSGGSYVETNHVGHGRWGLNVDDGGGLGYYGYFKVVSGWLKSRDLDRTARWFPQYAIDVSGFSSITISCHIKESGSWDSTDFMAGYYKLTQEDMTTKWRKTSDLVTTAGNFYTTNSFTQFFKVVNDFGSSTSTKTKTLTLAANQKTLYLAIRVKAQASNEYGFIDNVIVTGTVRNAPMPYNRFSAANKCPTGASYKWDRNFCVHPNDGMAGLAPYHTTPTF